MQTAESESRGLWEKQVPSQVWVAQARKNLTCCTSKERRNRNIGTSRKPWELRLEFQVKLESLQEPEVGDDLW